MIAISTITMDAGGYAVLDDVHDDYRDNAARATRSALLDGTVHINHSGVSDGDRTIRVSTRVPEALADILWYIFNNYTFVHVATEDGFYKAVLYDLKTGNGQISMNIWIDSKESE